MPNLASGLDNGIPHLTYSFAKLSVEIPIYGIPFHLNENSLSALASQKEFTQQINNIYDKLISDVYSGMSLNTHLKRYHDEILISFDKSDFFSKDFTNVSLMLETDYNLNNTSATRAAIDLLYIYGKDAHAQNLFITASKLISGLNENQLLELGALPFGFSLNFDQNVWRGDKLSQSIDKFFIGGNQDQNDSFIGGKGDDTMTGHGGKNTYYLSIGSGNDVVIEYPDDGASNNTDSIVFVDITSDQITNVIHKNGGLIIKYGTSDSITIPSYFGYSNTIDKIIFKDQSEWQISDILSRFVTLGTSYNDTIFGHNDAYNKMFGGNGDDTIYGGAKGNLIYGEGGNDIISGSNYQDTIAGGHGNDIMQGYGGSDIYMFSRGDGNDTIIDGSDVAGVNDKIIEPV